MSKKKHKLKTVARRFVIEVNDDKLHLAHLLNSEVPTKDFFKMYDVEVRELGEDETIYQV